MVTDEVVFHFIPVKNVVPDKPCILVTSSNTKSLPVKSCVNDK